MRRLSSMSYLFLCLFFTVFILLIPSSLGVSQDEAKSIGYDFIKNHAVVGHKGIFVPHYNIELIGIRQNELYYQLAYTISADVLGVKKESSIIVELDKTNGSVIRVLQLKPNISAPLIF